MQRVAVELDQSLRGGFINKVYQPLAREIVLAIRIPTGGGTRLVLSADPLLGRIHLTELKIANPPRPPRFCAFLRAHFQGSRIAEIKAATDDRVVRITATHGAGLTMTAPDLVLELLGRDSNILLVDRVSNRIMDCLHQIPRKETASRVVLPGAQYFSPPKRTAMAPTPGYDPNATSIMPGIRTETTGKRRLVLDAGPEDQTFPTMNEAVEAFFRPRLESLLLEAARRQAASPLKARIRSLGRRIEKIEADCRRLKEFESLAQDGELLKASLQSVRKGMSEVEVTDWETGMPRIVKLDPSLGPVANMDRLFKRAAKAKRGKRFVERRLNETIDEKAALEEMLHFVEQATDLEELELAAAWATGADVREAHEKDLKGAYTRERESALFREFQAPSGRPVLVGRSGRGNDFLLRQRAGKGDLWFHAKGLPGAHVLLPQRGKEPVATVDIECAAGLALYFSRARGAGKGEVIIARVEDLERPKGALPGQVMVKRHRTMMCRELKPGDHARKA